MTYLCRPLKVNSCVATSNVVRAIGSAVLDIFRMSQIFKVVGAAVGANSVLMVDFFTLRAWAVKRQSHQLVDWRVPLLAVTHERHSRVPIRVVINGEQPLFAAAVALVDASKRFHPAKGGNLINSFKTWDSAELFHVNAISKRTFYHAA